LWVCVTTLFSFGTCTAVLFRAAGLAACTRTRTRARMAFKWRAFALRATARLTAWARTGTGVAVCRRTFRFSTVCVWTFVTQAGGVGSVIRPWAWIVVALSTGNFEEAHRRSSRQEAELHLQKLLCHFDMFHTPWTNYMHIMFHTPCIKNKIYPRPTVTLYFHWYAIIV